MADLLGARNTGDTTETFINATPSYTTSTKITVTTTGIVTSVKMKLRQNSATQSGTMTVWLRDGVTGDTLATGTFDLTSIPQGDPAAWYEITVTGSPLIKVGEEVSLRAQRDQSGGITPAWQRQSSVLTFLFEVWGDASASPGKATTPTPTDDQEGIKITGIDQLKKLQWEVPT